MKKLLNSAELAKYLNVPISTVRHLSRVSKLPSIKIGKHLRFDLEQVNKYLEEKRAKKNG